jgi:tetratricopeptide (TPR) repeat protein
MEAQRSDFAVVGNASVSSPVETSTAQGAPVPGYSQGSSLWQELMAVRKETGIAQRRLYWQIWCVCTIFLITIGLLATAAVLLIPPASLASIQKGVVPDDAGEADFLKLFVPLFAVGFGFVLGLLGFKRLEQFDSAIESMRSSLATSLVEERKLSSDDRRRSREELENRVGEVRQDVQSLVDRYASAFLAARQEHLEETLSKASKQADEIIKTINRELEPYRWLSEKRDQLVNFTGIFTAGIAHERVESLYREDKADTALEIARYVLDKSVAGSCDDFHNLSSEFARHEQETVAADVTNLGLRFYPTSVDLLADGIKYNCETGALSRAQELYERLKTVDLREWNWRAFVFVGDFLELTRNSKEAMTVYERFRQQLPDDERGYSQPGAYYQRLGKYDEAIAILEKGMKACRRCAQVALLLAEIYSDRGEFEKAMRATDRALESNANEQPSVNQSAILWRRAIAGDSLVHKKLSQGHNEPIDDYVWHLARCAVIDYRAATAMGDALSVFRFRGPERIHILRSLFLRHNATLDRLDEVFGPAEI